MGTSALIDPAQVRRAIFDQHLFLEYLPTVTLADGRCVGCEALVRWNRDGEVVAPGDFIPIIENTPVSGLLTYWVIDTLAAELGDWLHDHPDVHIGINVPPEVLGRGGLIYAAYKANLVAMRSRIVVEVTERGVPDRLGLQELRDMAAHDVMIAMDDAGVDDVNLLVLARVPVDVIKLDRSYTRRVCDDASASMQTILRALVQACTQLIVAEGVETDAQARIMRDAGVQLAQGWLFSRPLPAADFIAWHARHG